MNGMNGLLCADLEESVRKWIGGDQKTTRQTRGNGKRDEEEM